GKAWGGIPYMPYKDYLRAHSKLRQLPDLDRKVYDLEKTINELRKGTPQE
ncbi:MAG: lpxD, partial [Mucilaginibacter sp.]|nr:lpxD [Mucilaginibacter sp.]